MFIKYPILVVLILNSETRLINAFQSLSKSPLYSFVLFCGSCFMAVSIMKLHKESNTNFKETKRVHVKKKLKKIQ